MARLIEHMADWGWRCRHDPTPEGRAVAWANYLALHRRFWRFVPPA